MKKYIKICLLFMALILMVVFLSDDPFEPKQQVQIKNGNEKVIKNKGNSSQKTGDTMDAIIDSKVVQSNYPLAEVSTAGVPDDLQFPQHWIDNQNGGNQTILTEDQIQNFNNEIYKDVPSVVNLQQYAETIQGSVLTSYINQLAMPSATYGSNNTIISSAEKNNILGNVNLQGIKPSNNVKFGLTVRKTSVRSFPTDEVAYKTNKMDTLDRFQLTGCGACEMVAVLHESKDSLWYFVQTTNYRGWVKKQDIAIVQNKKEAVDYVNSKNFIVINSDYISISFKMENGQDFAGSYFMGTRIPFVKETDSGYIVNIPVNDSTGNITYKKVVLNKNLDISNGYLKYTRNNIIIQAFKLNGADYDWGDKYNGRDCSSFILSVYKSFGFNLPRDTDQQEKIPGKVYVFNKNTLSSLKPGAAIFMEGHVVMYLGKNNGEYYLIQSFLGYRQEQISGGAYIYKHKVSVTRADILNASGVPFTDKFTKAIQIEK